MQRRASGQTFGSPLGWLRANQADGVLNTLNGLNGLPLRRGDTELLESAVRTRISA